MTKIIVQENSLKINDTDFNRSPGIGEITEIFGQDRISYPEAKAAKSTIHTYDDFGVWVYEEKGTVTQISCLIGEPFLEFHPYKNFNGDIVIKERNIKDSNDFLMVDCNEKWLDEWEAEGSVTYRLGDIACNMSANIETNEIEELDFWFVH